MIKLKDIIDEVSVAGDVGTFHGAAGDIVDRKFAGPFHPEFGQLKKTLHKQIDGDIQKRMYNDDSTPPPQKDFVDMEYEYGFDEPQLYDNSKFINNSNTNWKSIDVEYKYDEKPQNNSEYFINQSNKNWEYINKDYHTKMSDGDMRVSNVNITYEDEMEEEFIDDRDKRIYAGDNFINKSTVNWKYINLMEK